MNTLYRTMFFVPGNSPTKLVKSEIYGADCIIYDLEDSVSIYEKDSARDLVKNFLLELRPASAFGIRINAQDTPYYEDDVKTMVPLIPQFLRLPKSETAQNIKDLDDLITQYEEKSHIEIGTIKIIATIETALGVYHAYDIATASPRVIAIGLGAEDYRTDMTLINTDSGDELLFARQQISLAAHAAHVMPIDYVFSNFSNEKMFQTNVIQGKNMGFTGKSVIHPAQIPIVHDIYAPTIEEINHAKEVFSAYTQTLTNSSGVTALKGKMIDKPMVMRAKTILSYAESLRKDI
ncbi:CoA ester lyase [Veillonella sp. R32]|uniref:HpcH/HpaI aldolase/citrate lyase family protein n=1 Tax=Veillonella sp. R32 TaxID=2021312 RepID=UPI0013897B17|nr:aldolase/citrate lyase family protein [Veillonella sp. R32]KAF1682060.1 citrate lyase subunit beta [Veillonella sp. R32]